ncbi:hypothetical protein NPIL_571001 [Nephila pilipes]|uniref:Uncharacterized protein n=1 Tax=Nephila pilipes TaxID=299642 RepID=A0A8X6Q1I4_NEPPI|nr:hypothetical protein NPIL_571001 [Nephila pilipes]
MRLEKGINKTYIIKLYLILYLLLKLLFLAFLLQKDSTIFKTFVFLCFRFVSVSLLNTATAILTSMDLWLARRADGVLQHNDRSTLERVHRWFGLMLSCAPKHYGMPGIRRGRFGRHLAWNQR